MPHKFQFKSVKLTKSLVYTILGCAILLGSTSCHRFLGAKSKVVIRIAGLEVTAEEYSHRLARKLRDYDALYAKDQSKLKRAKEQVSEEIILELLTKNYAREKSISVNSTELETEVAAVRKQYPDENAFRQALANENLDYQEWRSNMEYVALQKKVQAQFEKQAPPPSDAAIKSFFEENRSRYSRPARVKLRQILLDKEETAQRIYAELKKGKSLESLARQYSIAPEGSDGGLTNWIEEGALEVFDRAFKLNVGARSPILKSAYGYHIYEVVKKEPASQKSLTEAKLNIALELKQKAGQELFTKWLDEQIRKNRIFKDEDLIQSIKISTKGE